MLNFITVSSLILLLILSACKESAENVVIETKKPKGPPESLLLPEHRDTITVYKPFPDSTYNELSFTNITNVNDQAYKQISFKHLSKVTIDETEFDENFGDYIRKVIFSDEVNSLDNQKVIIKGFLLPISHTDNFYFLSANPYASCFFCNQAGIESIIELKFNHPLKKGIKMDQIILVSGTLKLSSDDIYKLPYTLHDATVEEYY